jgi:hypothetical protein
MRGRRAVRVDPRDNVATLVDDATGLDRLEGGGPVAPGLPYGHKVATTAIPAGGAIVKYGVTIGRATADIPAGAHVHVHNTAEPGP